MTASTVETARDGGGGGESLRGLPVNTFAQGVSGEVMAQERSDTPSIERRKCWPISPSAIESSERPTAVVGHSPSWKSQLMAVVATAASARKGMYMDKTLRSFYGLARFAVCGLAILISGCSESPGQNSQNQPSEWVPQAGTFPFTLAEPGFVSAGVYDSSDRLVRELLQGEWKTAGQHTLQWDGVDTLGRPLPPGEYEWRVLRTPGFTAEFISMIGTTPTSAPYDIWPGNFQGITAIAVDESGMYLGSNSPENTPQLIKQSLDGREHHWSHGRFEPWQGPVALASDGEIVYLLQRNGRLWRLGTEVSDGGEYEDGIRSSSKLGRFDVKMDKANPGDMDATSERIVLVYRGSDAIRWLDSAEGEEQAVANVTAPVAVAVDADARAYVISEGQVLRFDRDGGVGRVLIQAGHLSNPVGIAYDRWRQEILVAEGAPSHQVKRFDRNGRLIQTYGRAGGRAWGAHVPEEFRDIDAFAAAPEGGFILSEKAPRRTVHVSRNGSVLNEWLGAQDFYNFASVDPGDPSRAIYQDGNDATSMVEINEARNTSRLVASFEHPKDGFGDGLFPPSTHYHSQWRAQRRHGELYLINDSRRFRGPAILRVDEAGGKLVPVAIAGNLNHHTWSGRDRRSKQERSKPDVLIAAMKHHGLNPASDSGGFVWRDLNGNGAFDPDEFAFFNDRIGGGLYIHIDNDWNVLTSSGTPTEGNSAWRFLRNEAPADASLPDWNLDNIEASEATWPAEDFKEIGPTDMRSISRDAGGNTYIVLAGNRRTRDDRHGKKWPTLRSGSHRIAIWNADGEFAGLIGRHAIEAPRSGNLPTAFNDVVGAIGTVGDAVVVADRVEFPARVYTAEGLYAGSFFDHRADDGFPPHVYAWFRDEETEHPDTVIPYDMQSGGAVVKVGEDEVLWTHQGENTSPLYRVSGWTGWERHTGTVTLAEVAAHASAEGTGLQGEFFANATFDGEGIATLTPRLWCVGNPGNFPGTERGGSDWSAGPVEGINEEQAFSVRWTGELEAPLSEAFRFSVYNRSPTSATVPFSWDDERGSTRVWIGGVLVIDTAARISESRWVHLDAGERYDLRIEAVHLGGGPAPEYHLNWESETQERQRVPGAYLYPTVAESAVGDLALSVSGTRLRPGETVTVRLEASRTPNQDVRVRLGTDGSTREAFDAPLPEGLILPAGKRSVSFTRTVKPTVRFARLFCAIEPTPEWTAPAATAVVEMLAAPPVDLFHIPDDERVLLVDDFSDPALWRIGLTSRIEDGRAGPLVESNGVGFSVNRDLPMAIDVRLQPVFLYARMQSLGTGWGARSGLQFSSGNRLGVYASMEGITMNGNAISGGHGAAGVYRFTGKTRPEPGGDWDWRMEFRMIDGKLTGIAYLQDAGGNWVEMGRQDTTRHDTPFHIPGRLGQLFVSGANNPGAHFDAAAVTVGPPYTSLSASP